MNRTFHRGTVLAFLLGAVLLWLVVAVELSGASSGKSGAEEQVLQQLSLRAQKQLGPQPQFRGQVEKFYAHMGDKPAWLQNGKLTPQGSALIDLFEHAERKGLRPQDYGDWPETMRQLKEAKNSQQQLSVDVALTTAAMRYISDLYYGRFASMEIGFALEKRKKQLNLAGFLATKMVHAPDVPEAIREVEPPFGEYQRTLAALHRVERMEQSSFKPLPVPKKSIHPGESYASLPELVARLQQLGDLPQSMTRPTGVTEYEGEIVTAVRRFQDRHGLVVDGIVGRATVGALNVPLRERVEQLELTLERWRWVPRRLAREPMIIVNIPDFRAYVLDRKHQWVMVQRVILGRAYRYRTPMFFDQMESVVFRPYWKVPYSIQRKELVPKIARNPGYLKRHDYEIVTAANRPAHVAINNATLARLRSGTLKLRQLPGEKNSLGLIKFDFPNPYSVYMHGTPAQQLFARARRDFSHGCIRVEHPAALAAWVLRDVPGWTQEKIEAAMHGTETQTVDLPHPIPVVILYGTAVVEQDGEIRFLPDIYHYDARLKAALARPRPRITAGH